MTLNGNKFVGRFLHSEAGRVRARGENPTGILPQHDLRKRGGRFALFAALADGIVGRVIPRKGRRVRGALKALLRKRVVTRYLRLFTSRGLFFYRIYRTIVSFVGRANAKAKRGKGAIANAAKARLCESETILFERRAYV